LDGAGFRFTLESVTRIATIKYASDDALVEGDFYIQSENVNCEFLRAGAVGARQWNRATASQGGLR
jgi:hypothetical protein